MKNPKDISTLIVIQQNRKSVDEQFCCTISNHLLKETCLESFNFELQILLELSFIDKMHLQIL